jgi:23S rRNA (cytosine1962-C5)-methyltransferase
LKRIILKPGEERRLLGGHPWVYDNEVARILGPAGPAILEPGELADVESSRKEYVGRAFVNPRSKIIARIYSPSKEGVDKGFFKRRFREALNRRSLDLYRESARIVFGEADFLPGLIVDRFVGWALEEAEAAVPERPLRFEAVEARLGPPRSWLSVQFLTYGMDSRREEILQALEEVLGRDSPAFSPGTDLTASGTELAFPGTELTASGTELTAPGTEPPASGTEPAPLGLRAAPLGLPSGIIEKSGAKVRELEGLPPGEGLLRGSVPASGILIFENGLPFCVHPGEGQKTGHFLDQRENRLRAAVLALGGAFLPAALLEGAVRETRPCREIRVLDACAYTGGFGIHAARLGAAAGIYAEVSALDVSAAVLETALKNAALNGVEDRIKAVEADLFDALPRYERAGERFDLIILDPPAFAKSRSALEGALRGYKEINLRAMKLLTRGGLLVSCSCSQALEEGRFKRMIAEAAADAERRLVQIDFRYQSSDHPILVGYDESLYLKCGYYRVW